MARIRACAVDELPVGEARRLDVMPPVTLFHAEAGFFALDDTCTHGNASLCEGFLEDDAIECPLHMARFSLRTGEPLTPPATRGVAAHPVVIEDGAVFVDVTR